MLQAATVSFLKDLNRNNNKEWFEKNRSRYENAKADFLQMVQGVVKELGKKDADIAVLEPKKCLFRINRDVRFSKDKSPYKTNLGASFEKGGRISPYAAYYLHIEPGKSFVAGGIWMPDAERTKAIRQEIDYNWSEFSSIIQNKKFRTLFNDVDKSKEYSLTREPKGYEKDNPAIDYIKLKSWTVSHALTDDELQQKDILKKITASFEALIPFIQFLNRAVEV